MLALEFRFAAGTYHATPWGRHVNEGEVEWPPSPWRVLRALLAGWYLLQSPDPTDEAVMRRMVHQLAQDVPVYRLPETVAGHSRHYLPLNKPGASALVFDAFLKVAPMDRLLVGWPDISLETDEMTLLDRVLGQISYLGRAESWATARSLTDPVKDWNCGIDLPNGSSASRAVKVLAPLPEALFQAWKDGFEQRAAIGVKPARRREGEVHPPHNIWDALGVDTRTLEQEKWSQPPGSRWVTYWVPERAESRRASSGTRRPSRGEVTTARLMLTNHKPQPRIQDALALGELLRAALIRKVSHDVDVVLTGHTLDGIAEGHHHGFFLAEDADNDGYIDHFIVHADQGLPASVLQALDSLRVLYSWQGGLVAPSLGENGTGTGWRVVLEGYGKRDNFDQFSSLVAPSREWVSVTPYLHPWHKKKNGRFGPEEQIRKELLQRGLVPATIERLSTITVAGKHITPLSFRRIRRKSVAAQPDRQGEFWRITFSEPISGPLALGFGCHFGLGVFRRKEK